MNNCLLLDFDGVIINNKVINHNIANKSSLFLSEHTHIKPHQAIEINKRNYRTFGHTLYLTNYINKHKKNYKPLTIDDFNSYVYKEEFIHRTCMNHINSNDIELFVDWVNFINEIKGSNICDDVFIFSNAPKVWIQLTIEELEKKSQIKMNIDDIISVPEEFDNTLKPDQYPYDSFTNTKAYKDKIFFVDDNETNLQYSKWCNFLFDPLKDNRKKVKKNNENNIKIISSPKDLYLMI